MGRVDLKNAFYSIPIKSTDRKYLKFQWNGLLQCISLLAFLRVTSSEIGIEKEIEILNDSKLTIVSKTNGFIIACTNFIHESKGSLRITEVA